VIPVLSPEGASALDREAEARGIPTSSLMERAGFELAAATLDLVGGAYGRRVVVVCGKGNNGGDGWVAARALASAGAAVCVVALAEPVAGGAAAEQRARVRGTGVRVRGPEALARAAGRPTAPWPPRSRPSRPAPVRSCRPTSPRASPAAPARSRVPRSGRT
jgi:NAD(P)H-hydrate repair Nnr-like enzyme with NAD(P)H-hydrate epimerase domain